MEIFDLRVTVERIEGRSVCGLGVGNSFEVTESNRVRIPEGRHFCLYALSAVLPLLPAKQRKLPDEDWLEQKTSAACPDAEERLIMRIERRARGVPGQHDPGRCASATTSTLVEQSTSPFPGPRRQPCTSKRSAELVPAHGKA
jgi:uncharacterized repeat protein (TIGR04076 family)